MVFRLLVGPLSRPRPQPLSPQLDVRSHQLGTAPLPCPVDSTRVPDERHFTEQCHELRTNRASRWRQIPAPPSPNCARPIIRTVTRTIHLIGIEKMLHPVQSIKSIIPLQMKKLFQHGRYIASERSIMNSVYSIGHISGYDRIYHYHVRKTAGTSLNLAFKSVFSPAFLGSAQEEELFRRKWAIIGGKLYVTHNEYLLERGDYFFGDGHAAFHEIKIPRNTFRITILRDPVKRVISHYRMLVHWKNNKMNHPARALEERYIGNSFLDYIKRVPKKHLMRQLYMFSENFDVKEATHNISKINFIMNTEKYDEHLGRLSSILGLKLQNISAKVGYGGVYVSETDRARLARILEPEYAFIEAASPFFGVHLHDEAQD